MDTVLIGIAGTALLGVLAWMAKTAFNDPRTYVALRPFILVVFAYMAMFGMGMLVGQLVPSTKVSFGLLVAGGGGLAALLAINFLAEHLHDVRSQRTDEKADEQGDL